MERFGMTADEIVAAVEERTRELEEALARVGITLPSLGEDPVTLAGRPFPLVALGNCNLETAGRLAEALRRAEVAS